MISYDDLKRSLATGEVCAFAGAGMSAGAGLPGWYDLIAELAGRIGYELPPPKWATGDALIDAAQAYVNRQGLHSLISHLKDRLDTTGKSPSAAHRALARLPISLVFTANFDDLLERAYRDAGKRVEVVTRDSSIPFMRREAGAVNILKLYGDLDQPDTIVLARQQYDAFFLQRPQMVKLLETELARSDTVYLGWSGADPYYKMIFGELLARFGGMMRPGYAVMFDVTDAQRDELARRQIRPVELPAGDHTAQLAKWLGSLEPASLDSDIAPLNNISATESTVNLIVPTDIASFEAVLRTIVERTGDRSEERVHLFTVRHPDPGDPRDIIRIAMFRSFPGQIVGTVNLPVAADVFVDLNSTDGEDFDQSRMIPNKMVTFDRVRQEQVLDAIICKLLKLGGERTEVLLTFRHPEARKYCKVLIQEILRRYPNTIIQSEDADLEKPGLEWKSGTVEASPPTSWASVLNTGKAWAVLVGVNHYDNQPHIPSLHVCVDDVTAVHAALAGKFTAARLLTDAMPDHLPTRASILGELSSVAQAAEEDDLLLFYFSGHGIAEGGESYLLPRDARLAALKHTSVAMKDVREIIGASPARAKVIVLDACHSGAAIGKAGPAMTLEFIERVFIQAEGMAVLASCKQGQQSWEWPEEGRSVFTHFLLEALGGKADLDGKGFVTVSDASRYVTDGVKAWAVEHSVPQTPTLQYTVAGDIVLMYLGAATA